MSKIRVGNLISVSVLFSKLFGNEKKKNDDTYFEINFCSAVYRKVEDTDVHLYSHVIHCFVLFYDT